MAFEGLYKFVDDVEKLHNETEDFRQQMKLVNVLVVYYETALSSAKFRDQRQYCLKAIHRLNPQFFKGYFKRENP